MKNTLDALRRSKPLWWVVCISSLLLFFGGKQATLYFEGTSPSNMPEVILSASDLGSGHAQRWVVDNNGTRFDLPGQTVSGAGKHMLSVEIPDQASKAGPLTFHLRHCRLGVLCNELPPVWVPPLRYQVRGN